MGAREREGEGVGGGNLNAITGELIKMAAAGTELQMVLLNAAKGSHSAHNNLYELPKKRRKKKKRRDARLNMRQVKGQT